MKLVIKPENKISGSFNSTLIINRFHDFKFNNEEIKTIEFRNNCKPISFKQVHIVITSYLLII